MKKKYQELLTQINKEVPQEWRDSIVKKVDRNLFMRNFLQKAVQDPDLIESKASKIKNLLKAGKFDETFDDEVDEEVVAKIDEFINNRIKEEIEKGNFPKYAFTHLFKKGRKLNKKLINKEND